MTHRRKRIIFYFETHHQLQAIKDMTGREAEVIAASDAATVEAAIRLYKQVDIVLAERQNKDGASLRILEAAKEQLPSAKRVMIASSDAIAGVYEAVYNRVIDVLVFTPCREDKIRESLGLAASVAKSLEPVVTRTRTPSRIFTPGTLPRV
jgi:DNA-binding NtrC family response regulator